MGVVDGNTPVNDNDWESITRGGDAAIQRWIDNQMSGRSCVVVLVGAGTAGRKWINYEIKKGWESRKGVLGVRIHGLKNSEGYSSQAGPNPFTAYNVGQTSMASIVPLHDPAGFDSKAKYDSIKASLNLWVEEAIRIRARY